MKRFDVHFEPGNQHRVSVVLHPTRAALRSLQRYRGANSVADADAFCWQGIRPAKDHLIAEIHLARSIVSVSDIAHESTHAAFHRATIIGLRPGTDGFEEQVATDAGIVADAIVEGLSNLGVEVKVFTKRK